MVELIFDFLLVKYYLYCDNYLYKFIFLKYKTNNPIYDYKLRCKNILELKNYLGYDIYLKNNYNKWMSVPYMDKLYNIEFRKIKIEKLKNKINNE